MGHRLVKYSLKFALMGLRPPQTLPAQTLLLSCRSWSRLCYIYSCLVRP
jgi:hypothetical protein